MLAVSGQSLKRRQYLKLGVFLGLLVCSSLITGNYLKNKGFYMAETNTIQVKLTTSKGAIVIDLLADKAPKTVENFLQYVDSGFYEGSIFHRVIDGFMIQGGGLDENMRELPNNAPIENEADNGLSNELGTVSMARTNDPHSATSQFFINVNNNDFLDHAEKSARGWGYAVFAKVSEGMQVVNAIKGVQTGSKAGHQDVPIEPIKIIKVDRL